MTAQLKDTPLRRDTGKVTHLEGDHVVVTLLWFTDTEEQLRYLTDAALTAERARNLADDETARAWGQATAANGKLHEAQETITQLREQIAATVSDAAHWKAEAERMNHEINTPETISFIQGVLREAAHQRERWGNEHDAGKDTQHWFWLIGALAGKAMANFAKADTIAAIAENFGPSASRAYTYGEAQKAYDKGLHHIITTAAALANWHLNATGKDTRMRAGRPLEFQTEEEPEVLPVPPALEPIQRRGNVETAGL